MTKKKHRYGVKETKAETQTTETKANAISLFVSIKIDEIHWETIKKHPTGDFGDDVPEVPEHVK